jgi:hypothetical protein
MVGCQNLPWVSLSRAWIQMGKTIGRRKSGCRSDQVLRLWAKRQVVEMEEPDRKSYTLVTQRLIILTLFQRMHSTLMTFSMNGQMPVR